MSFNVGILGGGNISQTHTRAALEIDGVRIAAVCGQNFEKVRALANGAEATAYQDLEAFFNHRPMDAVLIGTPSGTHAAQGIDAAQHGLHVLVEKPIDITTERADALIDACRKSRVKLGVFFQDRTAPDIVKLKELIDSGKLGKPILISASVRWYRPPEYYKSSCWRGTRALDGGGALMNQGIHTVDLLLWLFGDVSQVCARAITGLHDIEVEDTVVASFEFANGAIGNIEAATSAYPGFSRRLEMSFSEGTIVIENDRVRSVDLRAPVSGLSAAPPAGADERAASPVISDTRGHRAIIEDFIRAITTDGVPLCDGQDARRSVMLAERIYESADAGRGLGAWR